MKHVSKRLTYANVMSTIAIFLAVGGATAFAASQLAKNSVGSKQLQKNAVTAAKIKKNAVTAAKLKKAAVTRAKIKAGAVGSSQIADGAVTGTEINVASTPFSRIVGSLRQSTPLVLTSGTLLPIGTYTQPVGEADTYIGYADVTFNSTCVAPRSAFLILLLNPANPASPTPSDIAGISLIEDKGAGTVTRRGSFANFPGGYASMTQAAPLAATAQTFYVLGSGATCSSGNGIVLQGAGIDVLGTKAG